MSAVNELSEVVHNDFPGGFKLNITFISVIIIDVLYVLNGACGGAVVEALRYKPEGRGIDSRWCHWNFSLT
jgi:hypothetical protein